MRLQKYLAQAGVASRRKSEEYILQGRVKVNGEVVKELGTIVKEGDNVAFDNKPIKAEENIQYYMLNKPTGYITSASDEKDRETVLDLMAEVHERIFPVGRLDYNTSGLLILTNDGELTYKLTHPKHHVDKTYVAKVRGDVRIEDVKRLEKGVEIDDYTTAPAKVKVIKRMGNSTTLSITIHEGRNRQVRKMCSAIGYDVFHLRRVSIGKLEIGDLQVGKWRKLKLAEITYLKGLGE
ncbi:MAG: pseudouridine synthase [Cellulosilyticaceae bacterium]